MALPEPDFSEASRGTGGVRRSPEAFTNPDTSLFNSLRAEGPAGSNGFRRLLQRPCLLIGNSQIFPAWLETKNYPWEPQTGYTGELPFDIFIVPSGTNSSINFTLREILAGVGSGGTGPRMEAVTA